MSIRVDSVSLISGSVTVGTSGLGIKAENIPSTGDAGSSFLYDDLAFPADTGKEIRGRITTWPALGSIFIDEDGSFNYTGPSTYFAYQLYVDGVAVGTPQWVTIVVGGVTPSVGGYPAVTDVKTGVTYGANNEFVGTLVSTGGGSGISINIGKGFSLSSSGMPIFGIS